MKQNKYLYLEIMRIVACFFVIFNHTSINGFYLFTQRTLGGIQYWIYLIFSILTRFHVPLFFAISGALLLPKEDEDIKTIFKKRITKIIIVLACVSALYYLNEVFLGNQELNAITFFTRLVSSSWSYHLWYLYAYIAFLLSLPLLRNFVNHLDKKIFIYMFILCIIFYGLVPILQYIVFQGKYTLNANLIPTWIYNNIIMYPCLGYFLEHKVRTINLQLLLKCWFINVIGILLSCYGIYLSMKLTSEYNSGVSHLFYSSFAIINCGTMFISIKYLYNHFKNKLDKHWINNFIKKLSSCTFGIYLIHVFILNFYNKLEINNFIIDTMSVNPLISSLLSCLIIFTICFIIILALKQLPIIKRYI